MKETPLFFLPDVVSQPLKSHTGMIVFFYNEGTQPSHTYCHSLFRTQKEQVPGGIG